jgi:hypothetical protein
MGRMEEKRDITRRLVERGMSHDEVKSITELSDAEMEEVWQENALRTYLGQMLRLRQNARDLEIINREADHLNEEANDVLTYQVIP